MKEKSTYHLLSCDFHFDLKVLHRSQVTVGEAKISSLCEFFAARISLVLILIIQIHDNFD